MLEPGSGQARGREFGVQFSFMFKFLTIMQSGSGRSIFFQIQASDNYAVRNWTF